MPLSFRSRLGFKAAVSVALPMMVILAIASVASGVVTYRMANAQLERRVQEIAADDIEHISSHLWELDAESIQVQLDNYVDLGRITGAKVVDETGLTLQAGILGQDPAAYTISYPLEYPQSSGPLRLGVLTLEAARDESWALARSRIIALITIASLTVLLSIFLIHRLLDLSVLSPIKKIADDLRKRPSDWHDLRINLDRVASSDELDELVESVHDMRDHILASQSESAYSQTRLAQAAEIAGLGYATSDQILDGFLECDENYAVMHGKSIDEMLRLSIRKDIVEGMSHPDELARGRAIHHRILRGESPAVTARVRIDDGEYRHIKKIFTAKQMPDGRIGVVDIVAQDMTELHLMKERLLQTQKMEAIGKLTGGVAHDFNNILAVVSGNLELLLDEAKNEPLIGYAQTALIAVDRGATLTQRLLAFARKQTLLPEVTDISKLVRDSASLFQTSIGATIELIIRADGQLSNSKIDRAQLEAVLLNFVVNARDAMPNGGKLVIDVCTSKIDDSGDADDREVAPGEYVCISITDTGEGMSAATVERACDPFFTTKEVGKGTGLGLSMAFGFAMQSGGHLNIDSEPGEGTTVRLYLPRAQATEPANAIQATGGSEEMLKDLHILLVEDDESLRATIGKQLVSLGCVVTSAADGDTAVKLAGELPHVDILLSDIVLPGSMNGRRVAREIAGIFPDCPVVFMSGFVDASAFDDDLCDDHATQLQKPFSLTRLQQALAAAVFARRGASLQNLTPADA